VKPTRRRFTAEYKLEILREAEACRAPGELGALLRREGLYSSHLTAWRKQERTGLVEKKRGRRPERRRSDRQRIEQLERENAKLRPSKKTIGGRSSPAGPETASCPIVVLSRGAAVYLLERLEPVKKDLVQGCWRPCQWRRFGDPV
jgi:transposase-like protein